MTAAPDRRHRHVWHVTIGTTGPVYYCIAHPEPVYRDESKSRRGRSTRSYGNRAELAVARRYGGQKIGHHGGPVDVRGVDFDSQVKTHRRLPPAEWRKAFAAMPGTRIPRLLLRFVGTGVAPEDYIVIRGADWLAWFGRDEVTGGAGEGGAG